MKTSRAIPQLISGALLLLTMAAACAGQDGKNGQNCTVSSSQDGSTLISCPDGSTATVRNGANGSNGTNGTNGTNGGNGTSCTVVANTDGSKTIRCTDGTSATIRDGVDASLRALIASGPAGNTDVTHAEFAFVCTVPECSFSCALDGAAFAACNSPASFQDLAAGPHQFAVKAKRTFPGTTTPVESESSTWSWTVVPYACPATASTSWKFGVMADTQWTVADDGRNPNTVAVDVANQLNREFIAKGVKFVVQVGDLTDNGSTVALDTRVTYAQALYNAGIGFFPLRGNHESSAAAATEFKRLFPQTANGSTNATPSDAFVTTADDSNTNPVAKTGTAFTLGSNFSSPSTALTGLSYAFDYNNARLVLLDMFTPSDSSANAVDAQQTWISNTLSGKAATSHAFVFSHKGLITEDHVDTLFGANPGSDPTGQDAFINSLATNGVRYHVLGHDHMHDRTLVATTDGTTNKVTQLVCASDSSKFYTPAATANDQTYDVPAFQHTRQTPLAQELYTIGYYIFTVDGARATVEYYAAPITQVSGNISTAANLTFSLRESFGYAIGGKEYVVAPGAAYTSITDTSFGGTTARILKGVNGSTAHDGSGRAFSRAVDIGWAAKGCGAASDYFRVWGMGSAMGSSQTDEFALALSYDPALVTEAQLESGLFGLATRDANGNFVNAVDGNVGGVRRFVFGPWSSAYGLGTYGVDVATHTVWAVLDNNAEFVAARFTSW